MRLREGGRPVPAGSQVLEHLRLVLLPALRCLGGFAGAGSGWGSPLALLGGRGLLSFLARLVLGLLRGTALLAVLQRETRTHPKTSQLGPAHRLEQSMQP